MKTSKFNSWIQKILATEEEEISCSVCFDLVSDVVDLEVEGRPIPEKYLKVKQHLNQCRACFDEYETLIEFAILEAGSSGLRSSALPDSTQ